MRVLYHHRTQGRGVEAVHIHGICSGLQQIGFSTDIIGPPGIDIDPNLIVESETGKTGSPWGWAARYLPQILFEIMGICYNFAAIPRLWIHCRTRKPLFIYERYALHNFSGVLVARLLRIPIVIEVNDTADVDRTRQGKSLRMRGLARWFEKWIFQAADAIVTVSGYLRDCVISSGIHPDRVRVTPNAVDARWLKSQTAAGKRVRGRYGLNDKMVVGFAGSFTKWHRVDLLVSACAKLAPSVPELSLLLVGDGVLKADIEVMAAALGIADRMTFAGKVPHSKMPEYMAAMDIGVMPGSNLFGSPMKVFEYMATGCPPVAPRYGPLEETIVHGKSGLLFAPQDVDSLAESLETLITQPEFRRALGSAARQQVHEQHQWIHNAQQVVDLVFAHYPESQPATPVAEPPGNLSHDSSRP